MRDRLVKGLPVQRIVSESRMLLTASEKSRPNLDTFNVFKIRKAFLYWQLLHPSL